MYVYKIATMIESFTNAPEGDVSWFDTLLVAEDDVAAVKGAILWVDNLAMSLADLKSVRFHYVTDSGDLAYRVSIENACYATYDESATPKLGNFQQGGHQVAMVDLIVKDGSVRFVGRVDPNLVQAISASRTA